MARLPWSAVPGLETDYLVVGAGAAGMAITDELLTHTDATVALVDRRAAPGGQWLEAYPYVRLHQPSASYGVSSLPLGHDTIDERGPTPASTSWPARTRSAPTSGG